jgi:hypothetical protein
MILPVASSHAVVLPSFFFVLVATLSVEKGGVYVRSNLYINFQPDVRESEMARMDYGSN